MEKKEFFRALKFFLFSCSAGIIQLVSNSILLLIWPAKKFAMAPVTFYLIGLVLSVIWNVTFNRKFTFKSASNYTVALLQTLGFYAIFAPASCLLQAWITNGQLFNIATIGHLDWPELVGTLICMVINLLLEWPYQRFVVFRNSIDSNQEEQKAE